MACVMRCVRSCGTEHPFHVASAGLDKVRARLSPLPLRCTPVGCSVCACRHKALYWVLSGLHLASHASTPQHIIINNWQTGEVVAKWRAHDKAVNRVRVVDCLQPGVGVPNATRLTCSVGRNVSYRAPMCSWCLPVPSTHYSAARETCPFACGASAPTRRWQH